MNLNSKNYEENDYEHYLELLITSHLLYDVFHVLRRVSSGRKASEYYMSTLYIHCKNYGT